VKFQEQGDQISGTLEVSKAQTRAEIEQALPEIIRSLADSGVAIRRLEVVLSQNEQSGNQGTKDPLLQDGTFQQRDSANPGQSGHEQQTSTYYDPKATGRYRYQNAADPYEMARHQQLNQHAGLGTLGNSAKKTADFADTQHESWKQHQDRVK